MGVAAGLIAGVPDSRCSIKRVTRHKRLGVIVAIFCINCGKRGGMVTEEVDQIIYLCQTCSDKYGQLPLPEAPDPTISEGR